MCEIKVKYQRYVVVYLNSICALDLNFFLEETYLRRRVRASPFLFYFLLENRIKVNM